MSVSSSPRPSSEINSPRPICTGTQTFFSETPEPEHFASLVVSQLLEQLTLLPEIATSASTITVSPPTASPSLLPIIKTAVETLRLKGGDDDGSLCELVKTATLLLPDDLAKAIPEPDSVRYPFCEMDEEQGEGEDTECPTKIILSWDTLSFFVTISPNVACISTHPKPFFVGFDETPAQFASALKKASHQSH
mgnify:CR=1 FL=1